MMTIHRHPLAVTEMQGVSMHKGAQLLSVQMQDDKLMLWALVDTSKPRVTRELCIAGTGSCPCPGSVHIATVQDDLLVWHVFDAGEQ